MLVTLQTLEVGGQMHLTLPTMCEQYMFSMMHEIFNLFETHESYGATYVCQEDRTLSNDMCAMTGFRGLTQNILELLTKLNGLGDTSIDCIGCNNNGTEEYRNWIAQKIDRQIASLLEFENTVKNITVGEVIMKFKMEYMSSIKVAKKLGLEVAEWATNENYFKDIVTLLELTHVSGLLSYKKYDIDDKHSDVTKKKKELFRLSESVYQYVEKVDSKKYSSTELYFNNLYKNLNRSLATEYNITINGQYVSRAWMKMREILIVTDFFDNITTEVVNGFHICEAPGNFVASILYLLGDKYRWHAQSLKNGSVFDQYGFIKDNPNSWDFGRDGRGDIMNPENLIYYSEKYNGVDIVTGDCGEKWTSDTMVFAATQLIYALLTLRIGGNFIIKTFAGNVNDIFLNTLNLACQTFSDIFYYKSPLNFWSHEIYICGKGFRGITLQNKKDLIVTMKTRKNILAPISDKVFADYFIYAKMVIHTSSVYKKFFVFCAENPSYIQKYGNVIKKIVTKKNGKWGDYFLRDLKRSG